MTRRIIPAIMSGGAGTRLWPLSTGESPKQFHALGGGRSLIQETALRLKGAAFAPPIVIGSVAHAELIARHLAEADVAPAEVVLEPVGRNTAATAAIAAAAARRIDPAALVLLAPADHVIEDAQGFRAAVLRAAAAVPDRITTFGITPSGPETGYGYIQAGPALGDGVFEIAGFKEKPPRAVAEAYLAQGGYYWNAGIFLFAPEVLLSEFAGAADLRDGALEAYAAAEREGSVVRLGERFAAVPSQPVDIAVMEKTRRGAVAPCSVGWADVGSWSEVWRLSSKDEFGNASSGPVVVRDARDAIVLSSGPVVGVAGVSDIVVIATPEAVLVVPKDKAQDVKFLAEAARGLMRR